MYLFYNNVLRQFVFVILSIVFNFLILNVLVIGLFLIIFNDRFRRLFSCIYLLTSNKIFCKPCMLLILNYTPLYRISENKYFYRFSHRVNAECTYLLIVFEVTVMC